jgi:hypothetical protein
LKRRKVSAIAAIRSASARKPRRWISTPPTTLIASTGERIRIPRGESSSWTATLGLGTPRKPLGLTTSNCPFAPRTRAFV